MKKFDFKKYTEYKVYSVTTIKKGYGFRVLLKFADGTEKTKQHSGFSSERAQTQNGMKWLDSFMEEPTLFMTGLKLRTSWSSGWRRLCAPG
ncbi:hypothetical protein Lac3_02690 [Claveliimonas bilis]|nr:hypothetical protein Lac3_02690 [Claveliimonas bilis]